MHNGSYGASLDGIYCHLDGSNDLFVNEIMNIIITSTKTTIFHYSERQDLLHTANTSNVDVIV